MTASMKKILLQFDTDQQPSIFDRVVAIDAGVDELFSYGGVTPANVEPLVHGAIFTRGPNDLKNTAIFVGGSGVTAGTDLVQRIRAIFFGPMRVSVMMDSNGSNTTAAAAVLAAAKHVSLAGSEAVVLGGTGPVGQRAAQLLADAGALVRVASRSVERARRTCEEIVAAVPNAQVTPAETSSEADLKEACAGVAVVIGAGAAGVELLSVEQRRAIAGLKVAIDLNAVPPAGLAGIAVTDKGTQRDGIVCYGAIGVGGTKMKIHKRALAQLFESNDQVLDTAAIYAIAQSLG
jgi:hypothetical protein